jgi:hypothetical protein
VKFTVFKEKLNDIFYTIPDMIQEVKEKVLIDSFTACAADTHDDYLSLIGRLRTNPVRVDERALVDEAFSRLSEQIEQIAERICRFPFDYGKIKGYGDEFHPHQG